MNKEEWIKELENLGISPTSRQLEQLEKFYQFKSETDTEVAAQLIEYYYVKSGNNERFV